MDHALKIDNTHEKDGLISVTYISKNNEQDSCRELNRILEHALANNEENNITSSLIINKKYCIQNIEGSKSKINQYVMKLINDHQHLAIKVVDTQEIEQRRWKGVSMKFLTEHVSATEDYNPYLIEKDRIRSFIDSIFEDTEARISREPEATQIA